MTDCTIRDIQGQNANTTAHFVIFRSMDAWRWMAARTNPFRDISVYYLRYLVKIDYLQVAHVVLDEVRQIYAVRAPVSHGYARRRLEVEIFVT